MNVTLGKIAGGFLIALVGLSAVPVAAQNYDGIYRGGPPQDRRFYNDRDRYDRDRDRYDRDRDTRRAGCSPREALAAASRFLYDPRINTATRRYYAIDGFGKRGGNRGGPDSVYISTAPGCSRI